MLRVGQAKAAIETLTGQTPHAAQVFKVGKAQIPDFAKSRDRTKAAVEPSLAMPRCGPSEQHSCISQYFGCLKDADAMELEICALFFSETPEINTVLADAEGIQFWADETWERQALSHQTSGVFPLACGPHQLSPS